TVSLRMVTSTEDAVIRTRKACADAGAPEVDPERLGDVVSSGIGGVWTLLDAWDTVKERGARRVMPLTVPMLMPNSPAGYVSLEIGARARAHAPVPAPASRAAALATRGATIRPRRAHGLVPGRTDAESDPPP